MAFEDGYGLQTRARAPAHNRLQQPDCDFLALTKRLSLSDELTEIHVTYLHPLDAKVMRSATDKSLPARAFARRT